MTTKQATKSPFSLTYTQRLRGKSNEIIRLFTGNLTIDDFHERYACKGTISFQWLPRPHLVFSASPKEKSVKSPELGVVNITVGDVDIMGWLNHRRGTDHWLCSGSLGEETRTIKVDEADEVRFLVPNFNDFFGADIRTSEHSYTRGRLRLSFGDWGLTLDRVNEYSELRRALDQNGGFAATHIGQLRKTSGAAFSFAKADQIMGPLYHFMSFLRGFWTGPVLPVGLLCGKKHWQEWGNWHLTPWRGCSSWFPIMQPESVTEAFDGYYRLQQNPVWREPITHAIHWYVEANIGAGGIEGSIILTQTALELLSWMRLVETEKITSAGKFRKLEAKDKIGCLIDLAQIPRHIPTELFSLRDARALLDISEGPEAFAKIRNKIVHPRKVGVTELPVDVRIDVLTLGLWYLELSILSLLDYNGVYRCRFSRDRIPREITVPWAAKNEGPA